MSRKRTSTTVEDKNKIYRIIVSENRFGAFNVTIHCERGTTEKSFNKYYYRYDNFCSCIEYIENVISPKAAQSMAAKLAKELKLKYDKDRMVGELYDIQRDLAEVREMYNKRHPDRQWSDLSSDAKTEYFNRIVWRLHRRADKAGKGGNTMGCLYDIVKHDSNSIEYKVIMNNKEVGNTDDYREALGIVKELREKHPDDCIVITADSVEIPTLDNQEE